ncbi:ATP-binding protein [Tessaracoccus rhinocerotis]|uniref:ATP-binding protein n=1 Tax=Tessaracoccus rhinocerotis TaxID=1689449 RepID=A0A553K0X4_9ACTN|nr:ATP-binding protein [Tessaracoccus rhinocerotis]TRY18354.1 ATP-binding protein [Tessaracoccus rhinocerotis]
MYLARTVDLELDELMAVAPAVALDGPKGVGKTGTAARRADALWFLDDPHQRALAQADPSFQTATAGTLLLDEWQRLPQVWDTVRRHVDQGAPPGRFLLTGSASPVQGVTTHSGAGRILSLRMRPMAIHERGITVPTVSLQALLDGSESVGGTCSLGLRDYIDAITCSGFPGVLSSPERLRVAQLDSYLARIVDHDLPEQGYSVRRPETLRRWLGAYAAASSTTTSYSRILDMTTAGDGSRPAKTTTIAYRDHLSQLWLLDPVPGWSHSRSQFTQLQQAPKHQLADPALASRLLNLTTAGLLGPRGAGMAGPLFESLATLSVRVAAQRSQARVGHLRTNRGDREIDLVVEGTDGQVIGIEVRLSATVDDADVRHLLWLRDQLPDDVVDLVVLTTGTSAYRRPDGVAVVPLGLLGP